MFTPLSRRTVLRGAGTALALPYLDAMVPSAVHGQEQDPQVPARTLFMCYGIGMNMRQFYPEGTGPGCQLGRILKPLENFKSHMTAFSGTWLETGGGHSGDYPFLTGAPGRTPAGIINSISADQVIAQHMGHATRFPSLQLSISRGTGYGGNLRTLSWNDRGIPLAAENEPQRIFRQLFTVETARERRDRNEAFRRRRSVLDVVLGQARQLEPRISGNDREKLDEYFTSVREVEKQLQRNIDWSTRKKPTPELDDLGDYSHPSRPNTPQFDYPTYANLMYDLIVLAFQTDSTRTVTYMARTEGGEIFPCHGSDRGYHALTHHGNDPKLLDMLAQVDEVNMGFFARFLQRLQSVREPDGHTLLDRTMSAFSSGMGIDHSRDRLPTALFGGAALGLKHQGHIELPENSPLSRVWHTMVERSGVPIEGQFQDSTGVINEIL